MSETIIVIPCYNEAERLSVEQFKTFCDRHADINFLFVNDGSEDRTLEILQELAQINPDRFSALDLQPNRGKAEAVRAGVLAAFDRSPVYIGYWDADLATPLQEIPNFIDLLARNPQYELLFGARVKLLGRSVQRSAARHYLGRIFATVASMVLSLAIYDTQCGAKLFRATPPLKALFAEPFITSWVFDVEIIARLIRSRHGQDMPQAESVICEVPLQEWNDIPGSKVKPYDFLKAMVEMMRIYWSYLRN
ncbi:glycosyltransferase [Pseudanabaena sp. PCC 6802]|uniref:glycosyltransferase n=1 Tax=Pseudanabaena sp. PCC 6802 TaxID=118173 RepID=UPI00034AB67E|nr:glycosyltransferase [Pseudanabaena sp. PCC 6802]